MQQLREADLRHVATHLPRDVADLLKNNPGTLFVAGGFIRACVAGEPLTDVDLFGRSKQMLDFIADGLVAKRDASGDRSRKHVTTNAISVVTQNRVTVQFITRWVYEEPGQCIASFDFTVCQAVIWRSAKGTWDSMCSDDFYPHLAGRQLVYANPVRDEEAGGSLMRVMKYVRRGYRIQVSSLGQVVARLVAGIKEGKEVELVRDPVACGYVLASLLREVDPALVVDGLDVVEEGAPVDGMDDPEPHAVAVPAVPGELGDDQPF